MNHPIEATNDQLERFLQDLVDSDQAITSSEVNAEYEPLMDDWTVSESIAISAIANCRTPTQLLNRLCREGNSAGVLRVRHYVLDAQGAHPTLISKNCAGHSEHIARKLEAGDCRKAVNPESVVASQPFWSLLIRRPLIFVRSDGQRAVNTAPGILLCPERCLDVLETEKEPIWMDIPLLIGGHPYGKLSFDLLFLPDSGTAAPEIIRLWSLCQIAGPFIEVLSRATRPTTLGDHAFNYPSDSNANERLFSKLLVLEKALSKVKNTWIYAKAERKGRIVFTFVSDSFADAIGESPGNMIGRGDRDFNENDAEVSEYELADRRILEGRENTVTIQHETWTDKHSNAVRHFSTTKELVEIDGEPHVVGIATDVTDHFVLQDKLAYHLGQQSAVFGKVLDTLDCSVVLKNNAGRVMYCNQTFSMLVGHNDIKKTCQADPSTFWDDESVRAELNEEQFVRDTAQTLPPVSRNVTLRHNNARSRLLIQRLPMISETITSSVLGVCTIAVHFDEHGSRNAVGKCSYSITLEMSRKIVQAAIEPLCELLGATR